MTDLAEAFARVFGSPLLPMPHRVPDDVDAPDDIDPDPDEQDAAGDDYFNRRDQ